MGLTISKKTNKNFLYFLILFYIILIIYDFTWKNIILLIIFIYIIINILSLKILKPVDYKEESEIIPLVSIIIPAWNEEGIIERTIKYVLDSTYANFELIVVAGGEDKTFQLADNYSKIDERIKVIEQEPLGKSAALNKGLKHVNGEIYVFLDADSLVDKNWLKYLVKPIIEKKANVTVADFKPYIESWVSKWYSLNHGYLRNVEDKKGFFGGSTAFEKTIFDNGMVLDERAIADDYYLGVRLQKEYKIEFVRESIVKTDIPCNLTEFIYSEIRWSRILLYMTLLFGDRKKKVIFNFLNAGFFTLGLPIWLVLRYLIGEEGSFIFLKVWISYFSLSILLNLIRPLALYKITRNSTWLRYAWIALIFPVLGYLIYFYAVLTYRKVTPFFRGPRKLDSMNLE